MSTESQFSGNPAKRAPSVQLLFPDGVVVAQLREPGDASLLYPAEAKFLGKSVVKRVQEFAAGRLCARLALEALGIRDFPLLVAPDRRAVWPAGLVGSISHTAGLCIAAVARQSDVASLGVDCEGVAAVTRELWPSLFTEREARWLSGLDADPQRRAATLLFSAKEAFYKCQYPLTEEWLDFHDVEVAFEALDLDAAPDEPRALTIRATRPIVLSTLSLAPVTGRYRWLDAFVVTAFAATAFAATAFAATAMAVKAQ